MQGETIYGDKVVGDKIGGNKIVVGDVARSNVAIGDGAKVIVNNIQQALSKVDELEKSIQVAERLLAAAVEKKVLRYTRLSETAVSVERDNPYKALLDYKLEDAPFFYGRTKAIRAMFGKMGQNRLTVLHSDSGSGKSSLLQAGLASRLVTQGHLPLHLRPYRQPPGQFITKAFLPDYATLPELARYMQMSLRGFLERVAVYLGTGRLHIFLDQFEEFFTELPQEARHEFAGQLRECIESDLPVHWVLSLRKEFFSDLRLFAALRPFDNEYFLPTFRLEEAQEVISEPAARKNVRFEDGLVDRIVQDVRLDMDGVSPAQVQLVCYTLFDELQEEADPTLITTALYERPRGRGASGAQGILTSHLGRVLSRLSRAERPLARQILAALISSEKRRVVRSRNNLEQEIASSQRDQLDDVLKQLESSRLLRVEEDETGELLYELTHDYLLTEIELDPETQMRKAAQELLEQEVALYINPQFNSLLSLDRYEIINSQLEYLKIDERAAELLARSEERFEADRRREQKRQNVLIEEQRRREELEQSRQRDKASLLAEKASTELDSDPEIALLLATAAVTGTYKEDQLVLPESRAALLKTLRSPYRGTFYGHTGPVIGAVFSPDGKRLVTTSEDKTARLWDVESLKCIKVLDGHEWHVTSAVYAPDGSKFLTYSRDGTGRMWDAETGDFLFALEGHEGWINTAEFSPDGRQILTAGQDGSARLWDAESGTETALFGCKTAVFSACFNDDGTKVLTAEQGDIHHIWNMMQPNPLVELQGETNRRFKPSWSQDGTHIITGGDKSKNGLNIWSGHNYELLQELISFSDSKSPLHSFEFGQDGKRIIAANEYGHVLTWALQHKNYRDYLSLTRSPSLTDLTYDPQGKFIITTSESGKLRFWLEEDIDDMVEINAHPGRINKVIIRNDGDRIVTIADDFMVRIWDAQSLLLQKGIWGHDDHILDAGFDPDGRQIVTACKNGEVRLRDSWTYAQRTETIEHKGPVFKVEFNFDGTRLLTTAYGGGVHLCDPRSLLPYSYSSNNRLPVSSDNVTKAAAFTPDGLQLVTIGADGSPEFSGGRTGRPILASGSMEDEQLRDASDTSPDLKSRDNIPYIAAFSADGQYILMAVQSNAAQLWDSQSQRMLAELESNGGMISCVDFSPDGSRIVTGAEDGVPRLWDGTNGNFLADLVGHQSMIHAVDFSPDGRTVLTASADGTVRLWDGETGDFLRELKGSGDSVLDAVFSPDGRTIAAAQGAVARIWDSESGEMLEALEGRHEWILRVRFSPDGQRILTAGYNGYACIWPVLPKTVDDLLGLARGRLRRAFTEAECKQHFFGDDLEACPRTFDDLFPRNPVFSK